MNRAGALVSLLRLLPKADHYRGRSITADRKQRVPASVFVASDTRDATLFLCRAI